VLAQVTISFDHTCPEHARRSLDVRQGLEPASDKRAGDGPAFGGLWWVAGVVDEREREREGLRESLAEGEPDRVVQQPAEEDKNLIWTEAQAYFSDSRDGSMRKESRSREGEGVDCDERAGAKCRVPVQD